VRLIARFAAVLAVLLGTLFLVTPGAQAHPLGNFTVNHYAGLTLRPDRVDVRSVVDRAEIPTAQLQPQIDTNGDGTTSPEELTAYATKECPQVAAAVQATVTRDGGAARAMTFSVTSSVAETVPGAANLPTLRVTCELTAPAVLTAPGVLSYTNSFQADRVGWKEIVVAGDGVRTVNSPVPAATTSNELRAYPGTLLASPLAVDSVQVSVAPGSGSTFGATAVVGGGSDPFTSAVARADRYLQDLVGGELTPYVGVLAVGLSVLLGAGHAVLPGHGKTVMAAYLAGKRGSRRDALTVGATVTLTHTLGVIIIGVAFTAGAAFAGEQALRWLGTVSGVLVAVIGLGLLRSAILGRRQRAETVLDELALVGAGTQPAISHGHGDGHGHGQAVDEGYSRRGLIGMGVAGGLVPSPSATIVLVASLGLGRTVFGLVLVLAYGVGMAATLTAVGLLLVRVRHRLDSAATSERLVARVGRRMESLTAVLPFATAVLVLLVGLGLAVRGLLTPY
jgi:nickel/cobalt exporter